MKNVPVPSKDRAERGLSMRQLFGQIPSYQKNKARDDGVVLTSYTAGKRTKLGYPAVVAVAVSSATKPPRTKHKCSVIGLDRDLPIHRQRKVLVSCDCADYCFTWEYANYTWGASKIIYSNGDPAVVKNPANHPGACKHLVVLMKTIQSRKD